MVVRDLKFLMRFFPFGQVGIMAKSETLRIAVEEKRLGRVKAVRPRTLVDLV